MGRGYGDLIFGVIRGDPLSIGFFVAVIVSIFISLVSYTSYFKKMFPKLHGYLHKKK
jgi:uncharacterized membrane protein